MIRVLMLISLLLIAATPASAEIITLHNGDRLTGQILKESARFIFFNHKALGRLEIQKDQIKTIALEEAPAKPREPKKGDVIWARKVGAGYSLSEGNTEYKALNGEFHVNRNRMWIDEWTLKASGMVQRSRGDLSAQQGQGSARYAFSLNKELYNFYRTSIEHDYFENLKARIIPTAGFGYWFLNSERTKLLTELGLGYQFEFFKPDGERTDFILHSRAMISRKLTEKLEIGGDGYFFPSLRDAGRYHIEAEAFLRWILTERIGLKLKLQDQYKSHPANNAKRNDLKFISTLEYEF